MSTPPSVPTQLQLPLAGPPRRGAQARTRPASRERTSGRASGRGQRPGTPPAQPAGQDPGPLDDHTRQIGRQGIAAARARLAAATDGPAGRSEGCHPVAGGHQADDRGMSGHAA